MGGRRGERWLLHTPGAWEIAGASTFGRGAWEVPGASESAKWAACGFPGGPTPARAACDAPGAPIFELLGAWSVPGAPAAGSAARRARVAAGRPNSERRLRWARRADEEKGRLEASGRPERVWAAWKLAGAPNSTGNMAPAMFPVVTAALLIAAAASSLVPAALPAGGAGGARPPSAGPSGAPEAGSDSLLPLLGRTVSARALLVTLVQHSYSLCFSFYARNSYSNDSLPLSITPVRPSRCAAFSKTCVSSKT